MSFSTRPLTLFAAVALAACTAPLDDPQQLDQSDPTPDEPRPKLGFDLDIQDDVIFEHDLGAAWNCDGEDEPAFCMNDYLTLFDTLVDDDFDLEGCREDIVAEALELQAQVERDGIPAGNWGTDELREMILEGTGLRELRELRPPNPELHVRVISSEVSDGHTDSFLIIEDPLLGDLPVRRLSPLIEGPNPAILVLPGHPSMPDATIEFADNQHGRLLARAGYDVMILSPRAYSGLPEHLASTAMLCADLSMIAVRHLEALVLKRVLLHLQDIGTVGPIALMGHSGGAVQANVLARWDHSFDALVTDHFWWFVDVGLCTGDDDSHCVADSHCPNLLPFADAMEATENPDWAMPRHVQDYGYGDPHALIEFLRETVGSQRM